LVGGDSNHILIILELELGLPNLPNPFNLNPHWIKDSSFKTVIKEGWTPTNQDTRGSLTLQFKEKLKGSKEAIISWGKDKRKRIQKL